jgi:universal stress protein A
MRASDSTDRGRPIRRGVNESESRWNSRMPKSTVRLDKVLVAIDFSKESRKVLRYASVFACRFGAATTLLHVVEPISCRTDYGYGPVTRQVPNQELLRRAQRRLKAIRKTLDHGLPIAIQVRSGVAHAEITRTAIDLKIDLIIMGTHGNALRTSSTTEKVLRHAPCPVLVVRAREREFVSVGY